MLTMIGAVAAFERELSLERQAEGIVLAKAKGKYKGRKPTVKLKRTEVVKLAHQGRSKRFIAEELNVSISTVYRIMKRSSKNIHL